MEEGFVLNKPCMFKGANYDYCKERMIAFFESTHIDMLDVVEREFTFFWMLRRRRSPMTNGWMIINPYFFSIHVLETPYYALYQKNIPRFTALEAPNKYGTPWLLPTKGHLR